MKKKKYNYPYQPKDDTVLYVPASLHELNNSVIQLEEKINRILAIRNMDNKSSEIMSEYDQLYIDTDRLIDTVELFENRIHLLSDKYEREIMIQLYLKQRYIQDILKNLDINETMFIAQHNEAAAKIERSYNTILRKREKKHGK